MLRAVLLASLILFASACGATKHRTSPVAHETTVWLCRPGLADNPCLGSLTTTVLSANGTRRVVRAQPATRPPIDCFYVYPTVSDQQTVNANLQIGLRETEVAIAQASRFSQVCDVYAPVYRQITLNALDHPGRITLADALRAYASAAAAFGDYLAHDNHGRGFVLIGHSQGAAILIRLIRSEIDGKPAVRRRLVSAIVLGGNATNTDFAHVPACASRTQTHCVVAYSSFTERPPADSQFGRTSSDAGVQLLAPHALSPTTRVLCVNPAAPGGATATLDTYLPSLALLFLPGALRSRPVKTPWVAFPDSYQARCESAGSATWLQVSRRPSARGAPPLAALGQPVLGLHVLDVNLALGNLVALVRSESVSYRMR